MNSPTMSYFGSLLMMTIFMQIMTGMILLCYFDTNIIYTFNNMFLMKMSNSYMFLVHSFHQIGSNMLFMLMYSHICKNMLYKSYSYTNRYKWWTGSILYIMLMIMCFLGYVLPWGQMSFWAATVITNLFSMLPYGVKIICLLLGDNLVGNTTLTSFMVFHFLFSFLFIMIFLLHISLVHYNFTKKQKFISYNSNSINLINFIMKDYLYLMIYLFIFMYMVTFYPMIFNNTVNSIPANNMVTPKHIVPEWYLLWLYAMMKLMPNKFWGILLIVFLMVMFFLKTLFNTNKITYNWSFNIFIWFLILTELGFNPSTKYTLYMIFLFFLIFNMMMPLSSFIYVKTRK